MSNTLKTSEDLVIEKIAKHFYKGCLNFSLEAQEINLLTWDIQKKLADATINNQKIKTYPVNTKFSRLFFKKLIEFLETCQEVHDDFYTHLCSLTEKGNNSGLHYRHHIIANDMSNFIITKETNNMVINGTTGMRTWEAALMLADWILCNKHIVLKKKVLELGSGVGFTGMTMAKECEIDYLWLTDCHQDVLRTICDNVMINFPEIELQKHGHKSTFKHGRLSLEIMMLDWNNVDVLPGDLVPDILLGADIIYDPALIKPLCNVINTLFERNDRLNLYIANVIRNVDTFNNFLRAIDDMGLSCDDILPSKSVFIEWDPNNKFCLLNIKKRLIISN